jgi:hypothetical protein
MIYIKKPTVVEAIKFVDASLRTMDEISEFMDGEQSVLFVKEGHPTIQVDTINGPTRAHIGDMIVKHEYEGYYVAEEEEFNKIYDKDGLKDLGNISDGHHTFDELYAFRKMYNAVAFNAWAKEGLYDVHKSTCHNDGTPCYNGGWFIVMAILPDGQISNHYEMSDWDLFQCPEEIIIKQAYDGHTAADVLSRLKNVIIK